MRQIVLHPGEDGYWVAECPSLAGCISQGVTREAAISNIREAIAEYIAALEDDGLRVPESHRQGGAWVTLPVENRDLYVFHV